MGINGNGSFPIDVKQEWLSVIRRLQSVGSSRGYSVVSISILVDKQGTPVMWTEPTQKKLEPWPKTTPDEEKFLAMIKDPKIAEQIMGILTRTI